MKAGSAVLTQIQGQMTFLGLPVALVGLMVGIGFFAMTLFLLLKLLVLMIPAGIVGMAGAWLFFIKKVKDSPHFAREIALPPRFWKSNKRNRLLNVGVKR